MSDPDLTFSGEVVRVHEGETISVGNRGRTEEARLSGIDCPQLRQTIGAHAGGLLTLNKNAPAPSLLEMFTHVEIV